MNAPLTIAVLTIAAPLAGGLAGLAWKPSRGLSPAAAGSAVALVGAIALIGINATGLNGSASANAVIDVDPAASLLMLLTAGVGTTVQSFAGRYLRGGGNAERFALLCGAVSTGMMLAAVGATLTVFALGWAIAGIAACLMLAHRSDLPEAVAGARRTAMAFAIGDGALLVAVGLVLASGGDLDLRDPAAAAGSLADRSIELPVVGSIGIAIPVAALACLCALARSAQFPLHRWLPSTLAAPTPASAMLHAGLVNGAGLLLIKLAPAFGPAPALLWVLLAAGLITATLGSLLSRVRPDIKGSLAWSTTAQMGFMVAQCATGAFAGALLHILGHGAYKSALFLGSGSAVDREHRQSHESPRRPAIPALPAAVLAGALAAAALTVAVILIEPTMLERRGHGLMLAFAWVTAASAGTSWLSRSGGLPESRHASAAGLLVLGSTAWVGAVATLDWYLGDSLPSLAAPAPSPWLIATAVAGAALAMKALDLAAGRRKQAADLRLALWVRAARTADTAHAARIARPTPRIDVTTAPTQTQVPTARPIGATR